MFLVFFIVYLSIFGYFASRVLDRFFNLSYHLTKIILGAFAVFTTLSFIAGAAILFLRVNGWVWLGAFVLNGMLYIFLAAWAKNTQPDPHINNDNYVSKEELCTYNIRIIRLGAAIFLALTGYGFYLLYNSQTGNTLFSPWQAIKPQYIYIFFASTLIVGLLIFSRLKTGTILLLLMVETFLLHSYLPLSHTLIYGADGWRHMANEQRFLEGKEFLQPTLANASAQHSKTEVVKSKIAQLSYGNFWASNVILAKIFQTDLIAVTKWFLPVMWASVFPLLLFEIGLLFGWGRENSLFIAWLGLLPFAWASAGSFTLPANFGLLIWLFFILLVLKRFVLPKKKQKLLLAVAGLSLAFGYILYFILFWLAWLVGEFLRSQIVQSVRCKKVISILVAIVTIPGIELLAGYSHVDKQLSFLGQVKQLVGNFSGFYLASGPRPHDIFTGNIIFNQTPLAAFVPNFFTEWRWWLVIIMLGFFTVIIYGYIQIWRDNRVLSQWLAVLAPALFGGYIISNYFLSGSHILARRLDGVVAFFLISLFCYGLYHALSKIRERLFGRYSMLVQCSMRGIGIFILSIVIAASYSLGPDTYTVNAREYGLMQEIWKQDANYHALHYCVLADTYPLLALEAISGKQIIGGNFPIDAHFGQPELQRLYYMMRNNIDIINIQDFLLLHSFDGCWYVEDGRQDRPDKFNQINKIYPRMWSVIPGSPEAVFVVK